MLASSPRSLRVRCWEFLVYLVSAHFPPGSWRAWYSPCLALNKYTKLGAGRMIRSWQLPFTCLSLSEAQSVVFVPSSGEYIHCWQNWMFLHLSSKQIANYARLHIGVLRFIGNCCRKHLGRRLLESHSKNKMSSKGPLVGHLAFSGPHRFTKGAKQTKCKRAQMSHRSSKAQKRQLSKQSL